MSFPHAITKKDRTREWKRSAHAANRVKKARIDAKRMTARLIDANVPLTPGLAEDILHFVNICTQKPSSPKVSRRAHRWYDISCMYDSFFHYTTPSETRTAIAKIIDPFLARARPIYAPRHNEYDTVRSAILQTAFRTGKLESCVRVVLPRAAHPYWNTLDGVWYPKSQLPIHLIAEAFSKSPAAADPILITQ